MLRTVISHVNQALIINLVLFLVHWTNLSVLNCRIGKTVWVVAGNAVRGVLGYPIDDGDVMKLLGMLMLSQFWVMDNFSISLFWMVPVVYSLIWMYWKFKVVVVFWEEADIGHLLSLSPRKLRSKRLPRILILSYLLAFNALAQTFLNFPLAAFGCSYLCLRLTQLALELEVDDPVLVFLVSSMQERVRHVSSPFEFTTGSRLQAAFPASKAGWRLLATSGSVAGHNLPIEICIWILIIVSIWYVYHSRVHFTHRVFKLFHAFVLALGSGGLSYLLLLLYRTIFKVVSARLWACVPGDVVYLRVRQRVRLKLTGDLKLILSRMDPVSLGCWQIRVDSILREGNRVFKLQVVDRGLPSHLVTFHLVLRL